LDLSFKGFDFCDRGFRLVYSFLFSGLKFYRGLRFDVYFAADVFDYSFEAIGYGLKQRFRTWRTFDHEITGLGGSLLLTSLLPGLTVLLMPVAVLGATTLVAGRRKENS